MYIIVLFLSVLYMWIGFTGLLSRKMSLPCYLLMLIHLLVVNVVLSPMIGQFVTFPLVLCSIAIVYFGCDKSVWDSIFSLSGYLIAIFMNHLGTFGLTLLGISFQELQTRYAIPFLIAMCVGTALLQLIGKKFLLLPHLRFFRGCSRKLQWVFLFQLLICVGLIAINFIYGEMVNYPPEVLTFNGLIIALFSLITLVMFYCIWQILEENYTLKLQQREQEILQDYTQKIEGFYEDFRVFRHDYKNILATLDYYIQKKDWEQLQSYYQNKILPSGAAISSDKFSFAKLHLIEIPSIKSILYTKMLAALTRGISLTLELTEPVTQVSMDDLDLSRVLGILLDNSMEAALLTPEKFLSVAIITTDEKVVFSITNSCCPLQVPVSNLFEKGYTTKEQHDGLGLYTVKNFIDKLDNAFLTAEYKDNFRLVLEITNL